MNRLPAPTFRLLCNACFAAWVALSMFVLAVDAADKKVIPAGPPIWPGQDSAPVVRETLTRRVLLADETWGPDIPRFLDVEPGASMRNIVLAPIGAGGFAPGAIVMVRFQMPAGGRVMFREQSGGLLGMVNGGAAGSIQWAVLRAGTDRWEIRSSARKEYSIADGVMYWMGAVPVVAPEGPAGNIARPEHPRTSGYSIRFETDAPSLVFNGTGEPARLRVLADGAVAAVVDLGRTGSAASFGVELGVAKRRRIELLVDEAALGSVESPDGRHGIFVWGTALPQVRMLVLGDSTAEGRTRTAAWAAAHRLDYECWSLNWGDGLSKLAGGNTGLIPQDVVAADIAAVNPDLVLVTGRLVDPTLEGDAYASMMENLLDSVGRAARPEAVKVFLPGSPLEAQDRRTRNAEKMTRQRDFLMINWQGWARDAGDELLAAGGAGLSEAGQVYVGARLAEELKKLDLDLKLKVASMKRTSAASSAP